MGVKNLWDILESCKKTLPLHHLQNKRLCVDLSCWVVQLHSVSKNHSVREKVYLKGLFHRLRALIALNCSLILVTDGSIPALKLCTYRKRLGLPSEINEHDTAACGVSSLRRNKGSMFSSMIKEATILGFALGIPCLEGLEEGEAQCALLNSEKLCDGCFSADSDAFLFGARTVYRDIVLGNGGYVICYDMLDIERTLGFGRNSLIMLALILGSDYSHGLQGFGPEAACQLVKSMGDTHVLHNIKSNVFLRGKKIKGRQKSISIKCHSNKNPTQECMKGVCEKENDLGLENHIIQVIDAYLKPKTHSADSEAVQRACIPIPFQRQQLQKLCANLFGWGPEKTDGYILPKIGERDLRRYASLRTCTSLAGLQIPLEKLPVPCPISSILQRRKKEKRECFEVSWQCIDGLKSSVVSADLLKSACPEKITEFMEKETTKGKRVKRARAKPMEADVLLNEVDLQLRSLLISIESESHNPASSDACNQQTPVICLAPEVIDLLSPPSSIDASKMPKHQQVVGRSVVHTVAINLSHYNSDVSDGHEGSKLEAPVVEQRMNHAGSINICSYDMDASDQNEGITLGSCLCDGNVHPIDLCGYDSDTSDVHDSWKTETGSHEAVSNQRTPLIHPTPDIIDLLSPDPSIDASKMSKLQQVIGRSVVHTVAVDLSHHNSGVSDGHEGDEPEATAVEERMDRACSINICSYDIDAADLNEGDSDSSDVHDSSKTEAGSHEAANNQREHSGDVIDITDSDIDTSPEHKRKASELRLFINNIRDDMY